MLRITHSIAHLRIHPAQTVLAAFTVLFAIAPAAATEPSRSMSHDHLLAQARLRFEARRLDVAARKTPEAICWRQELLRAKYLASLGDLPGRTPLDPRVVGTLERDGFRIEWVIYEPRPGHHVTAILYLPEGNGPFPGVLVHCGHSANRRRPSPTSTPASCRRRTASPRSATTRSARASASR